MAAIFIKMAAVQYSCIGKLKCSLKSHIKYVKIITNKQQNKSKIQKKYQLPKADTEAAR